MDLTDYEYLIELRNCFQKAEPLDTSKDIVAVSVQLRDDIVSKLNEILGKYSEYFIKK